MNWLSEYISEAMIQVLGMTFLHSIWQGVLAVFLVSMAFYIVKNKRADVRYNISMGSMVVFFLAVCCTFAIYYQEIPDAYINNLSPQIEFEDQVGSSDNAFSGEVITETSIFNPVYDFLNRHAQALVLFWLVGIVVLSVRFVGGFLYIRKLRTTGLSPVSDKWQFKLEEWGLMMGLNKLPSFYESTLVKSPMTFGYLKPMILFPLGMLTSMPVQHLDAMLVHELMHIKNVDYLTNLFLSVVEILLFFNPAVWWLSGAIRTEMEHRCDDMAITMTGNKMNYVYALVAMQENLIYQDTELGLGMARNKSQLTERVNRLFGSKRNRSVFYGRSLISFVVLLTSVLLLAFSSTDETILDSQTEENLMKDSIASPKKEVYYFNNKIIDKDTFYKVSRDSVGTSHGLLLEDRVELRFYTDMQMYEAWKMKTLPELEETAQKIEELKKKMSLQTASYNELLDMAKNKGLQLDQLSKGKDTSSDESILIVDGEVRPIEDMKRLNEEKSLGFISLNTGPHAEAISKEYKGKSVWVVTTKNDALSNQIGNKEIYQGVTKDSIRFRYFPKTRTLQTADKSHKVEIIHVPEGENWRELVGEESIDSTKQVSVDWKIPMNVSKGGISRISENTLRRTSTLIKENPGITFGKGGSVLSHSGRNAFSTSMGNGVYGLTSGVKITFSLSQIKSLDQDSIPPLVIVDGVKVKSISMIDPKAIESMSALKGKAAIEAYGEEGANGVLLITTKQIKDGAQDSSAMINLEINNYQDYITYSSTSKEDSSSVYTMTGDFTMGIDAPKNGGIVIRNMDSSKPLILVDGIRVKNMSDVYPTDIESIEVLKNNQAIKKYGKKGANGVILIKTKDKRETKHTLDTKLQIDHQIIKSGDNFFLRGKVTGNITKKNVTDAFIRFDDNSGITFYTDENGEFEMLIPSEAKEAVFRHYMLPSEYVSVDMKKNESKLSRLRLEKTLKVHPNPTSDIVKIQLFLDEDSEGRVMVDIIKLDSKNTVKNLSRKKLKKGVYEFEWDSSKEIAGVYLVTVQNGDERMSRKVVVVR